LELRAHEASPAEPLDIETVRSLPDWNALLARGEPVVRAEAA
jgi:hypothetical protein